MRSRTPDRLCVEAVGPARAAAEELAGVGAIGEHLGTEADGERLVTHRFSCKEPAYRGWSWAVTVARASRSRLVTVDEAVLLPGPDALLAPEWVPWSTRLRPGDMGPGDLLPTEPDDLRLEPGWLDADGADAAPDAEAAADRAAQRQAERAKLTERQPGDAPDGTGPTPAPTSTEIGAVARELGLNRARVLSRLGLTEAADRWEEAFGPDTPMASAAPGQCTSCGFLVPLAGKLRQSFGLCSNEYAPADGHVVSLSFGCGGHSEAAVMPAPTAPPEPVMDELVVAPMSLHGEEGPAGS